MSHIGFEPAKGPSSPQRSRHQITRSISELSSPIRLHRHHSNRAAKDKDRDALSLVAQTPAPSNSAQIRKSLDGPPSGAVTPNLSPNPSRRTSILVAQPAENSKNHLSSGMGSAVLAASVAGGAALSTNASSATMVQNTSRANNSKSPSNRVNDASAQDREKAIAARESGLRTTLSHLETIQTASTRRLDTTYESVLERLGTLQSTIIALKELAGLSQDMNKTFTTEASELVQETSSQLDAFGQFEDQQKRIEILQRRVHVGRDKITGLSDRVDRVKERIERWERADREWQERTRRRLRWVWMITSVLLLFVGAIILSAQYTASTGAGLGEVTTQIVNESLGTVKNATMGGSGQEGRSSGGTGSFGQENGKDGLPRGMPSPMSSDGDQKSSTGSRTLVLPTASSTLGDRDLLRAFDEL
ncbi:hypothetical protein V8F06_000099 [Rhypophila decipiens]